MMDADDLTTLEASYGKECLIDIIRSTRDYLKDAIKPPGLKYKCWPIRLDLNQWGRRTEDGTYVVCIASLWYLMHSDFSFIKLTHMDGGLPTLARFLDDLRYPLIANKALKHLLGVDMLPYYSERHLRWNSLDPYCVLEYLDALVTEYNSVWGGTRE